MVALAIVPPGLSAEVPGLALVSGSRDQTAKVWDIEVKEAVRTYGGHKYQVNGVGALPGGSVATGTLCINSQTCTRALSQLMRYRLPIGCRLCAASFLLMCDCAQPGCLL